MKTAKMMLNVPGCFGLRRQTILFGVFAFFLTLTLFLHHERVPIVPQLKRPVFKTPPPKTADRIFPEPTSRDEIAKMHLLLPSSSPEINLCKTLLTASVLGYPVPRLIAWNETYSNKTLIGGGRYLAKIEGISKWLESQLSSRDSDLVLIVDAYGGFNTHTGSVKERDKYSDGDAWFQLPVEVLVGRYNAVNKKANHDLKKTMGKAFEKERIHQNILFATGKRCTPNKVSSAACYPLPDSPLPQDMYGQLAEEDAEGVNLYLMERQRYLSSAWMMGPLSDLRRLYRRALEQIREMNHADPMLFGSDQVIFQRIFGEQEYGRETLRRRYGESPRKAVMIEGTPVEDALNPSFQHEKLQAKEGKEDEFGIGLDYYADLGQQLTQDSEDDAQWVIYKSNMQAQLLRRPRKITSCVPNVSGSLPIEILNATALPRAAVSDASQFSPLHGWDEIPLYTNICLDTIPAIVTHSGNQVQREKQWPEMWLQPHGRRLIDEVLDRGDGEIGTRGGAWEAGGDYRSWGELCPSELDRELYRDYYDPDN